MNIIFRQLKKKEVIPLASITESNQIYFEYRYILGPLIYKAFQLATQHLNDDNVNKAAIYACYGEILIEQNKYDSAIKILKQNRLTL